MKIAMKNIQEEDFKSAIKNLDKSLKINPTNPSALYFKGYLQIINGENDKGCKTVVDAIYYNSNTAKTVYAEKCLKFNPKLNIEKFKVGKFSYHILNDNQNYLFDRKNDIQYEYYEGKTYQGKINWLGNGDYTIIANDETEKIIMENPKFYVRVLKIVNNEYLYEKVEENQIQFGIIKKL